MGQFSWDSAVLSRDVKGKGFGETVSFESTLDAFLFIPMIALYNM